MDIQNIRRWRCVVRQKNEIVEHQTEYLCPEGMIPDQNTCDLSTYDGYRVEGGRLLEEKRTQRWTLRCLSCEEQGFVPPLGGICDECLKHEDVKKLVPYVKFV